MNGVIATFRIPNSYYVPDGKVRLLSPYNWAQAQATTKHQRRSYGEHTNGNECVLYWDNGSSKRTIELGRFNNVATFSLAPGYENNQLFCCEAALDDQSDSNPIALPVGIISDDEHNADDDEVSETADEPNTAWSSPSDDDGDDEQLPTTPTAIDFALNGPASTMTSEGERTKNGPATSTTNVIIDEEDRQPSDLAELLRLHHQYGHISMKTIQEMAKQGVIPKRLSKCRRPTCSACLYSKATKHPWRGKHPGSERKVKLSCDQARLCRWINWCRQLQA